MTRHGRLVAEQKGRVREVTERIRKKYEGALPRGWYMEVRFSHYATKVEYTLVDPFFTRSEPYEDPEQAIADAHYYDDGDAEVALLV